MFSSLFSHAHLLFLFSKSVADKSTYLKGHELKTFESRKYQQVPSYATKQISKAKYLRSKYVVLK